MSVNFANLFTALGKIGAAYRNLNGFRGDTAPSPSSAWGASGPAVKAAKAAYDEIRSNLPSGFEYVADNLYAKRDAFRSAQVAALGDLQGLASTLIVEVVHADAVLPSKTIDLALKELVRQMVAGSASVEPNATSVSVTAGGANVGDAKLLASLKGPDGKTRECVYPETFEVTVATDKNTGAAAGSESIAIVGELAEQPTGYRWPQGSGSSKTLTLANPTVDSQTGNFLKNSDFEDFTDNTPTGWAVATGTPGSTVLKNVTVPHLGSAALEFVGNGAELTAVTQTFGSGTTQTLKPGKVYAFHCWVRVESTPLAGVLAVELVNGSDAVVNDDAGTANQTTLALTGVSTTYVTFGGYIRTPTNLPSTLKLRVRLSTAIDNGISVYVDDLALVEATELYAGGPYVAAFRGGTDVVVGDRWDVTVANDKAGVFQTLFWQWFTRPQYQLPSSGSATIADSLVA